MHSQNHIKFKFQSYTKFISDYYFHHSLFTYIIIFIPFPEVRAGDVGKSSKNVMPFLPSPFLYKKVRFQSLK